MTRPTLTRRELERSPAWRAAGTRLVEAFRDSIPEGFTEAPVASRDAMLMLAEALMRRELDRLEREMLDGIADTSHGETVHLFVYDAERALELLPDAVLATLDRWQETGVPPAHLGGPVVARRVTETQH